MSGLICNFCGKDESDVLQIIKGPAVYICNECVELCSEILRDAEVDETIKLARKLAFAELYGTD